MSDSTWLTGRDPVTGLETPRHPLAERCPDCRHPWLSHRYPQVGLGCPPWKYRTEPVVVDGLDYGYTVTPRPKRRS